MIELFFAYGIANSKAGPFIAVFISYMGIGLIVAAIAQEITRNKNGITYNEYEWIGGIVFWPILFLIISVRFFCNVIIGIFNVFSLFVTR